MVSKRKTVMPTMKLDNLVRLLNEGIAAGNARREQERQSQSVIPKEVYDRLSPNRQQVIDTLTSLTHPDEDVWVRQVYAAVNDGFFEKAGRLIWPHSTRLARRMLDGLTI